MLRAELPPQVDLMALVNAWTYNGIMMNDFCDPFFMADEYPHLFNIEELRPQLERGGYVNDLSRMYNGLVPSSALSIFVRTPTVHRIRHMGDELVHMLNL